MCPKCLAFALSFYILVFSVNNNNLCIATDTISQGQSISGSQTIVSKGGKFELGFFTPGTSLNYYIGIWYKKISKQTVIWVANRETAVTQPHAASQLKLTEDGNLVIFSDSEIPVWSTNSTSSSSSSSSSTISIVATLLDSGNLVLTNNSSNSSSIVWQSFDHPTDTKVPGSWLGLNKITGKYQSLTSWKNSDDPAPGLYTDSIDHNGAKEFMLLWNNSKSYWRTGVWNGQSYALQPTMRNTALFVYNFEDDNKGRYFIWNLTDNRILARSVIDSSGQLQTWMWFDDTEGWVMIYAQPASKCDVYSACGAFGICDQTTTATCSCPTGFKPTSIGDWNSGCTRNTHIECGGTTNSTSSKKDGFLVMPNMQFSADSQEPLMVKTSEECEMACSKKCFCTAYTYENSCTIWIGDIRNLQVSDTGNNSSTLYLRLAASDLPQKNIKKKYIVKISIGAAIGIIILVLTWIFHLRRRGTVKSTAGPLFSFTYNQLRRVTKNFSYKLGSGGFGAVYKGLLPDSTIVAVKKLEGISQGEKQFRSELLALGRIQHVNVVRLRGFCCEGTKKLLVYDYLPNGSLNHYLCQKESKNLDWKMRYQIILGMARGLTYLHENCRECIIHCDIKPENILLDSEFCPKLADFGMAKLIGRDFSRVLTTLRGTIGYLAPEWIAGLPITPKADVYSYGMLLFEVISGRRNSEQVKDGGIRYFPIRAAHKVVEDDVISLVDEHLEGCVDMLELNRACRVACWCIQDSEEERPTMGEIVKILEGNLELDVPPVPATLERFAYVEEEE